jgi:class 3 adenylate cyclase
VRLGIASGLVVVGDLIGAGASQERGVVGEMPNLAARLQMLAKPGTLVVAEGTRRQIGALFELEDARLAAVSRVRQDAHESGKVICNLLAPALAPCLKVQGERHTCSHVFSCIDR